VAGRNEGAGVIRMLCKTRHRVSRVLTPRCGSPGFAVMGVSPETGFTLVELLLALTLAGLVLTVAARIVVQTLRIERRVEQIRSEQMQRSFPLDRLDADLDARIAGNERISIRLDANHRPRLEMFCLAAEAGDEVHAPRVPARVVYRLARTPGNADDLRWIRETHPLVRPSRSSDATIARGLTGLEVALFDGDRWRELAATSRRSADEPRAIRITLRWRGRDTPASRTYGLRDPDRDDKPRGSSK
jgi:prepilin-type N-terminal cleavage/methylation domain-containing protein